MRGPNKAGLASPLSVAYRQVVTGHAGRVSPAYQKATAPQMELLNRRVHGQTSCWTRNPFGEGAATFLFKKTLHPFLEPRLVGLRPWQVMRLPSGGARPVC